MVLVYTGKDLTWLANVQLTTEQQNKKLFEVYTSQWMYDLVSQHIPKPYLFNDQIVVKLPGEQFNFSPHRDNQFGPLPDDANLVTQNFTLVLDDFTTENGALPSMGK